LKEIHSLSLHNDEYQSDGNSQVGERTNRRMPDDPEVSAAKDLGSEPTRTAFRSPWQNGVAERWVGSCRRDFKRPGT
jgi:hypothetical protein